MLKNMFLSKKIHITFYISALIHIFLLIILFLMPVKKILPLDKKPVKVIKSYLYKKYTRVSEYKEIKNEPLTTQGVVVKKVVDKKKKQLKERSINMKTEVSIKPSVQHTKAVPYQKKISAYSQLDSFKKSINSKIAEQLFQQQQRFRSSSVMHGKPIPVPNSKIKLTPSQIKEKNTTRLSDSISITKHDNGTCTIERKPFLGSPVLASLAKMACGESKFDKNFREHMKKYSIN